MEKARTAGKLTLVLVASAALSFAQTANTLYPPTYPSNAYQPPAEQHQMVLPGTVNYVEGQVSLNNEAVGEPGPTVMQPGNDLSTGDGYAEVLLTPGAFVRIGPNSQMVLNSAGLAGTQIQLDRGTANVEVDQLIRGTRLTVAERGATAQLQKNGLYDFNADQRSVKVLDGKADVVVGDRSKLIGKGEQLLLGSNKPLKVRDFNMGAEKEQPLYVWSEARSQSESQANVAMAQNVAANGGWYGSGWYWDPYWDFYAFLPGDGFLYSPFGWGFYSPWYAGYWGGYGWGRGYGHWGGGFHGGVGGFNARVGGFGGGFHGGGFGGGGFHGGGGGGHR